MASSLSIHSPSRYSDSLPSGLARSPSYHIRFRVQAFQVLRRAECLNAKSHAGKVTGLQARSGKLEWATKTGYGNTFMQAMSSVSEKHEGSTERSYVMIKPDGVQRGLVGEIISRFERKGFTIKGLKLFRCSTELAEEHYKDLSSKPFFPKLVEYITSGPVVCLALEGPGVVASARKLIGVTNPLQAEPGTIRGDLGIETGRNVVHGSDSPDNGEREIGLWFKEGELCEWELTLTPWLRE